MTREEAIKHIITYAYYDDDIPLQVATALDMAISALRAQQEKESKPTNGWISVQDRLPEEKGRYLTANKRFGDKIVVFDLWFGGGFWYVEEEDDVFDFEVTHWMPLPNPPKGE